MPSWVPLAQLVQNCGLAALAIWFAALAVRGGPILLRAFMAFAALKTATIIAVAIAVKLNMEAKAFTHSVLYLNSEPLFLSLVALAILETWWGNWPAGKLPYLLELGSLTAIISLLVIRVPEEEGASWAFDRTRRQAHLVLALFLILSSLEAWRRRVRLDRLWWAWCAYVSAHVLSRLISYQSYETEPARWAGYFAAAFITECLVAVALYGWSAPGGGSSAGFGRG